MFGSHRGKGGRSLIVVGLPSTWLSLSPTAIIVAINTDASVRALDKAPNRPVNPEAARALVLASLSFVDAVVLFEQNTPLEIIENLKPDVLLKGADYDANQTDASAKNYIVGSDFVKSYGGKVQTIPFVEGYSTTGILAKGKF